MELRNREAQVAAMPMRTFVRKDYNLDYEEGELQDYEDSVVLNDTRKSQDVQHQVIAISSENLSKIREEELAM
jgi:hypothetical protein